MFNFELFMSAFAILFVIIDPPGCAPIFATLTQGTSKKHQRAMAFKSVAVAAGILFLFAFFGEQLFNAPCILIIALCVLRAALCCLSSPCKWCLSSAPSSRESRAEEALEVIDNPEDISVFPMGIPMIAGPGTIASLLLLMSEGPSLEDKVSIFTGAQRCSVYQPNSVPRGGLVDEING